MEPVFGISLTNIKELAAAIAGIAGFAFTFFRIGRAFGNKTDKNKISEQQKKIDDQSNTIEAFKSVLTRSTRWRALLKISGRARRNGHSMPLSTPANLAPAFQSSPL
jgi:hypothetical protein